MTEPAGSGARLQALRDQIALEDALFRTTQARTKDDRQDAGREDAFKDVIARGREWTDAESRAVYLRPGWSPMTDRWARNKGEPAPRYRLAGPRRVRVVGQGRVSRHAHFLQKLENGEV